MLYNNTYQKNPTLWGNKPSILLTMFEDRFLAGSNCLDLGCGQGRDALYLAKKGFNVTAIDSSDVAINQLKQKADEEGISIETVCSDILSFDIAPEKYQLINIVNVFQFLPREQCLKLISDLKNKIAKDGFIIIKSFTVNDAGFIRTRNNKTNTFFQSNELKELFSNLNSIHYFEYIMLDSGHGDMPEPHLHGIVEIVAQK
ncbi:MAG: methyltransferase domain-containing protein [bacterium]